MRTVARAFELLLDALDAKCGDSDLRDMDHVFDIAQAVRRVVDTLHQPPGEPRQTWWAFECCACSIVWDVRTDEPRRLESCPCPVCGAARGYRSCWPADCCGYGGRGCGNCQHTLP